MVKVEIKKRDLEKINRKLNFLSAHMTPILNEIGDYLVSETTQRFKDSSAPDGSQWAPVKRGGKPLVSKGHLRDSIHYETSRDGVETGSNLIYAAIHQLGGQAGGVKSRLKHARF